MDVKFLYEHLTPIVQVKIIPPKSGFGKCDLQVTNASSTTVKNVDINWILPAAFKGTKIGDQFRIETLAPRESKVFRETKVQYNQFNSAQELGSFTTTRKDIRLEKAP